MPLGAVHSPKVSFSRATTTMTRKQYLKDLEALNLFELEKDREYFLPKCEKHKVVCNMAISNSKRYPKTAAPYCPKCAEDF